MTIRMPPHVTPRSILRFDTMVLHEWRIGAAIDRLHTIRVDAAVLTARFRRELERQAAAAAEKARQAAIAASADVASAKPLLGADSSTGKSQKSTRMSDVGLRSVNTPRHSQSFHGSSYTHSPSNVDDIPLNGIVPGTKRSKKKKRSALANASNPHHLRNYVPSWLPSSNSGSGPAGSGFLGGWGGAALLSVTLAQAAQSFLGPPPLRFLTADRRRPGEPAWEAQHGSALSIPKPAPGMAVIPDEWMCSFCEYDLFFGSEGAFRRAVKARKKILRRRRRARERAARAANGQGGNAGFSGSKPRRSEGAGANEATPAGPTSEFSDGSDAETEDEDDRDRKSAEEGNDGDYGADEPIQAAPSPMEDQRLGMVAGVRGNDNGAG